MQYFLLFCVRGKETILQLHRHFKRKQKTNKNQKTVYFTESELFWQNI